MIIHSHVSVETAAIHRHLFPAFLQGIANPAWASVKRQTREILLVSSRSSIISAVQLTTSQLSHFHFKNLTQPDQIGFLGDWMQALLTSLAQCPLIISPSSHSLLTEDTLNKPQSERKASLDTTQIEMSQPGALSDFSSTAIMHAYSVIDENTACDEVTLLYCPFLVRFCAPPFPIHHSSPSFSICHFDTQKSQPQLHQR